MRALWVVLGTATALYGQTTGELSDVRGDSERRAQEVRRAGLRDEDPARATDQDANAELDASAKVARPASPEAPSLLELPFRKLARLRQSLGETEARVAETVQALRSRADDGDYTKAAFALAIVGCGLLLVQRHYRMAAEGEQTAPLLGGSGPLTATPEEKERKVDWMSPRLEGQLPPGDFLKKDQPPNVPAARQLQPAAAPPAAEALPLDLEADPAPAPVLGAMSPEAPRVGPGVAAPARELEAALALEPEAALALEPEAVEVPPAPALLEPAEPALEPALAPAEEPALEPAEAEPALAPALEPAEDEEGGKQRKSKTRGGRKSKRGSVGN